MDHERVNISTTRMSCGVMELSRIDDETDGVIYALGSRLYHPSRGDPCAFFVFSDIAEPNTSSERLAKAVKTHKLGTVDRSLNAENPKTGNIIVVYVWSIDHVAFKKRYSDLRVKRLAKVGT